MKVGNLCWMIGLAALLGFTGNARATSTALVVETGVGISQFDASSTEWSKTGSFIINKTAECTNASAVAYGRGAVYVYDAANVPSAREIKKYSTTGTYLGTFIKIPNMTPDCMAVSPDGVYLYFSCAWGAPYNNIVYRYRLSDGEGGAFLTGFNVPRELSFDAAGNLYVADRNSKAVKVFDTTTGELIRTISLPSSSGGVYCDAVAGKVYMMGGSVVYVADVGSTDYITTSVGLVNCFSAVKVGGSIFYGDFSSKSVVKFESNTRTTVVPSTVITGNINGMAVLDDADVTADTYLRAHWMFNETANAKAFTNSCWRSSVVIPRRWLQSGAAGVEGGSISFQDAARGEMLDSKTLIPATNDFSMFMWVNVPTAVARTQYLFSNNTIQSGRVMFAINNSGKLYWFSSVPASLNLSGTTNLKDGKWHNIGVVRRGNTFELWADGVLEGSATASGTAVVAQDSDWFLSGMANEGNASLLAGPCYMDDLRIYDTSVSASQIAQIYSAYTSDRLTLPTPTRPALPAAADRSVAANYGTVIDHACAIDCTVGPSALLIASDGTYYVARDCRFQSTAVDDCSIIYKSTDKGATWMVCSTNTACKSASLFERNGIIYLVGLTGSKVWAVAGSTDGCATWETKATSTLSYLLSLQPGPAVFNGNRLFLGCRAALPGQESVSNTTSFLTADFTDGGTVSALGLWAYPTQPAPNVPSAHTFFGFKPGVTVLAPDGNAMSLFPVAIRDISKLHTWVPEYAGVFQTTYDRSSRYWRGSRMLPGASKPFCVRYDATSGLYWAITVATHPKDSDSGLLPQDIRRRLSLYSSPDMQEWRFHEDIVESADYSLTEFDAPAFDIDGDDIVLTFSLTAPDGDVGVRFISDNNFLCFRRIAGFRSIPCEEPGAVSVLVPDNVANRVVRFYKSSTGEWYQGTDFASGTYDGLSLASPWALRTYDTRVFLLTAATASSRILEFTRKGEFVKTIVSFGAGITADAFAISYDGKTFYVSDSFTSNAVFRVDRGTGAFTTFLTQAQTGSHVRELHVCKNGDIVTASREGNRISIFNPSGALVTNYTANAVQSMLYDEDAGCIYWGSSGSAVNMIDLATGGTATLLNAHGGSSIGLIRGPDDELMSTDWTNGLIVTPGASADTMQVDISGLFMPVKPCLINLNAAAGMQIYLH